MTAIACSMIRGGTSRGAYFLAADLPGDIEQRDALLLRIMGGPDILQIDGIGGGHPLTSKVAIVSVSSEPDLDVDYLFLQIDPLQQTVTDVQNCGNILAGVGLFAVRQGMVAVDDAKTVVRVRMLNSGGICHLELASDHGRLVEVGNTAIDGVPGTAPPIVCYYLDIAGATCGRLLPTGNNIDVVDGYEVTCIDNGMPVIVLRATDFGLAGSESPDELDANDDLKAKLESIRLQLGPRMNLGDVADKSVPKMCLVSQPRAAGLVTTRTFIPHVCHKTIGVLGAVSVATACLTRGAVGSEWVVNGPSGRTNFDIEHPAGAFTVQLEVNDEGAVVRAGVVRTARLLFSGEVMV